MEDKLTNILDNLTLEETSQLLDSKLDFTLDKNTQRRIINSTKKKCGLNYQNSLSNKLSNILHILLSRKSVVFSITSLVLILGLYTYAQSPTTYVSLDINPSVELGINKRNIVVHCIAYNTDGEKLLNSTTYKNLRIDNAITNLLSSAIDQDYVSNNKSFTISLATTVDDKSTESKLNENLKNTIFTTLKANNINSNADIITSTALLSKRNYAKNIGLSFGKLNLIESLINLSPSIKLDEYKDKSIDSIQQKLNDLKNENISSISKDQNSNIVENNTSSLLDSNSTSDNTLTNNTIVNSNNTSSSNNTTDTKPSNNSSTNNDTSTNTTPNIPPTSSGGDDSSDSSNSNDSSSNDNNNKPNNGKWPEHGHRPNKPGYGNNKPNRPNKPSHGSNKPNKPEHCHDHNRYDDDRHNNKRNY